MHAPFISLISVRTHQLASVIDNPSLRKLDGIIWLPDEPLFGLRQEDVGHFSDLTVAPGFRKIVEIDLSRFPVGDDLVHGHPDAFAIRRSASGAEPVDPRKIMPASGEALARLRSPAAKVLCDPMAERLCALVNKGVSGFYLRNAERIDSAFLSALVARVRGNAGRDDLDFIIDIAGATSANATAGVNFGVVPLEGDVRNLTAINGDKALPVLGRISDVADTVRLKMHIAAASILRDGMIVPFDILERGAEVAQVVTDALETAKAVADFKGEVRRLTGSGSDLIAFLRSDTPDVRQAEKAVLVLMNASREGDHTPHPAGLLSVMGADFEPFHGIDRPGDQDGFSALSPGEVRLLTARRARPIIVDNTAGGDPSAAASGDRLVLEKMVPSVDGGNFAVKRVVGEQVRVEATLFADGHEQLGAELLWRACDDTQWQHVRMEQLPNDLWRAEFPLRRLGVHEFVIEGWLDRFGGFRRDFAKKLDADVAQPVDFAEGRVLVEHALDRAEGAARDSLTQFLTRLDGSGGGKNAAAILLSTELAALMASLDERPHRIRSEPQRVDAERLAARFSSWYELFPRSQTNDAARHGTFAGVIDRLPAIREMGFDTLYFPPIHPIGKTNRKGPNNSLTPGPNDPGSPYAIGAPEGGHDAIHPELGSFEDFGRLIAAARDHGLEIALDFAIQCSPDHPWLREHPGWFAWRPDGSMKYAENPPKKYQDIVNVDFYGPDAVPGLWLALRDVVLFWIGHGVKTFRVDNPHTKPLPFWEWMIGDVRSQHPDAIFLAEAFTRPAMMYRLAKIGFSQSYTYFTWRDEKAELVEYVTELISTAPKEFYRPHFFVNTPDINPPFLQTSGRPGFRIRAVLAATLSGLFGVYSGFELCEAAPVPGKEEYLDSEKYEIRPRDWNAPGNIIADITLLNRLRRSEPALQTHLNTRFQVVHNDRIIYYAKPALDGSDMILVMVSLDPHHPQEGMFEIPLWEFGLPDDGNVAVEDLAEGHRFRWYGKTQHIRLDPEQPYRIWRIAPGDRP